MAHNLSYLINSQGAHRLNIFITRLRARSYFLLMLSHTKSSIP